jgi:hypothetical protein
MNFTQKIPEEPRFNGVNNYVLANPSVLANWNTGTNVV